MEIQYSGLTLRLDHPHLPRVKQVRRALLEAKRRDAYVNAPAEELEEFARKTATAIHLSQNGARYRQHAASYTPKDAYGAVRQADSLASLARQEEEAQTACTGFSWESVSVSEQEIAEALAIFDAAIERAREARQA